MCVEYGWCCTCGVGWKHGSMEENTLTWFYRSTPKHIPACRSEFTLWLHPVMLSLYCFYSRSTKYIDCLHGNVAQSCRYFFFLLTFQALWLVNMVHAGYIAGLSLVRVSLLSKPLIRKSRSSLNLAQINKCQEKEVPLLFSDIFWYKQNWWSKEFC